MFILHHYVTVGDKPFLPQLFCCIRLFWLMIVKHVRSYVAVGDESFLSQLLLYLCVLANDYVTVGYDPFLPATLCVF